MLQLLVVPNMLLAATILLAAGFATAQGGQQDAPVSFHQSAPLKSCLSYAVPEQLLSWLRRRCHRCRGTIWTNIGTKVSFTMDGPNWAVGNRLRTGSGFRLEIDIDGKGQSYYWRWVSV